MSALTADEAHAIAHLLDTLDGLPGHLEEFATALLTHGLEVTTQSLITGQTVGTATFDGERFVFEVSA